MVSLLIVTHCELGRELLNAAEFIVGKIEAVDTLSITQTNDSEAILSAMKEKIAELKKKGENVLILTDMFGGTPSNISLSFLKEEKVEVITGVNLPMIIAFVQNRKGLGLEEVAEKAQAAGKAGISIAGKLLESE
ncbi:MAG: PTS sugar transporter [Deltaproteobacteria bacterium]|nr:PTS sugar transporter [Deltaproteobacteria bacterium]